MAGGREALINKFDPIARTTTRVNSWEDAVAGEAPSAIDSVFADKAFILKASESEIDNRIKSEAEKRAMRKGSYPPPKMFDLPKESNPLDQVISTAELPVTVPSHAIIRNLPRDERPRGTADILGLQGVQDLATGQFPKVNDIGEALRVLLPTVMAASPQLRGKSAFPLIRGLRSFMAAEGGAILSGGAAPIFAEAERLRQEADQGGPPISRIEALGKAATETPGIVSDVVQSALGDAVIEGVTAGGAFGVRAARDKLAKVLDVDSEYADMLIDTAAKNNIDLSVRDVSTFSPARRAGEAFGRFPFVNKYFVEGTKNISQQFGGAYASVLSAVAPEIKSFAGRGNESVARRVRVANRDLLNGSSEAYVAARSTWGGMYGAFERAATESGAIVRPANTVLSANEKLAALKKVIGQKKTVDTGLLGSSGERLTREIIEKPNPRGDLARVQKELSLLSNPEDAPSVMDFRGSMERLQGLVDEVGGPNTTAGQIVVDVLTAMRRDFSDNLVGDAKVLQLKKEADAFYKNSVDLFGGRVGELVRDIDKEYGKIALASPITANNMSLGRRAGSVDPINTINHLFASEEPTVIEDLHKILTKNLPRKEGEALFRKSYGIYLASKFNAAAETTTGGIALTNTKKLRKSLGLDSASSPQFIATAAAMKRSGVSMVEFQKMLALTDRVFEHGIPDISQLITRRMLLGGLGSGARTFAPTTGAVRWLFPDSQGAVIDIVDRVATSAAVFTMMGGGAKRLTDPVWLKAYRTLLDDSAPIRLRSQALRRLFAMDASFMAFDKILPQADYMQINVPQAQPQSREQTPVPYPTSLPAGVR